MQLAGKYPPNESSHMQQIYLARVDALAHA
jgi:hypothetical protein